MNIQQFEKMLDQGRDSALLRFTLGKGYLDAGDSSHAITHLSKCVEQDPNYSAAWQLLGKAQQEAGDLEAAQQTWEHGIATANNNGDLQAVKVMTVLLKRLSKMKSP